MTQTDIDSLVSANPLAKLLTVLSPFYGRMLNLTEMCSHVPGPPSPLDPIAYLNPIERLTAISEVVQAVLWEVYCECSACPPITTCGGANNFLLQPSDGWLEDPVSGQYRWRGLDGQEVWVRRISNGVCYGPLNGLYVSWNTNIAFDPNQGVHLDNYSGTGYGYNANPPGNDFTLQVFVGAGAGTGPVYPWPAQPFTVADPPAAPACDPTTVCTALDYLYNALNVLTIGQDNAYQQLATIGAPSSFVLPGLDNPVLGTLSEVLETIALYLAPITADQLATPTVTPLTTSGPVDVTNTAYASILVTNAPDYMGRRGSTAQIWYSNARGPGPGWALLYGDQGVLAYYPIVYPDGLQIVIPPLATSLLVDILPGVELSVTTYTRSIS